MWILNPFKERGYQFLQTNHSNSKNTFKTLLLNIETLYGSSCTITCRYTFVSTIITLSNSDKLYPFAQLVHFQCS